MNGKNTLKNQSIYHNFRKILNNIDQISIINSNKNQKSTKNFYKNKKKWMKKIEKMKKIDN